MMRLVGVLTRYGHKHWVVRYLRHQRVQQRVQQLDPLTNRRVTVVTVRVVVAVLLEF